MSIIGQAVREGFKDLVIRIIERRIKNLEQNFSASAYDNRLRQEELRSLKLEIMNLDTD